MIKKKKFAVLGLSAGLVAGSAAAAILESTGASALTTATTPGTTAAATAATTAGTTAATTPASDGTTTTTATKVTTRFADEATALAAELAPLVSDGTLTQDQADKVVARLQATRHPIVSTVATTLGISMDDVANGVRGGKSLAQLATDKGKTAQDLIDALTANAKARLDAKVASQDLTQKQADARLAALTTQYTTLVNSTRPNVLGGQRAGGINRPGGMGGQGGMNGPAGNNRRGGMGQRQNRQAPTTSASTTASTGTSQP